MQYLQFSEGRENQIDSGCLQANSLLFQTVLILGPWRPDRPSMLPAGVAGCSMLTTSQELLNPTQDIFGEATSQLHSCTLPGQLPDIAAADATMLPDTFAASLAALENQASPRSICAAAHNVRIQCRLALCRSSD